MVHSCYSRLKVCVYICVYIVFFFQHICIFGFGWSKLAVIRLCHVQVGKVSHGDSVHCVSKMDLLIPPIISLEFGSLIQTTATCVFLRQAV